MTKAQKKRVKHLKKAGLIENEDFRVVYFGIHAEIKLMY